MDVYIAEGEAKSGRSASGPINAARLHLKGRQLLRIELELALQGGFVFLAVSNRPVADIRLSAASMIGGSIFAIGRSWMECSRPIIQRALLTLASVLPSPIILSAI